MKTATGVISKPIDLKWTPMTPKRLRSLAPSPFDVASLHAGIAPQQMVPLDQLSRNESLIPSQNVQSDNDSPVGYLVG